MNASVQGYDIRHLQLGFLQHSEDQVCACYVNQIGV